MRRTLVLLALTLASSCSKSEPTPAPVATTAKAKDPAAAKAAIAAGATVIDVRTPDEFAAGHLPTATNIPVQELGAHLADVDKLVGGDRAKTVVLYCASGMRAKKAQAQLDAAGYTNTINGGGLDDLR